MTDTHKNIESLYDVGDSREKEKVGVVVDVVTKLECENPQKDVW